MEINDETPVEEGDKIEDEQKRDSEEETQYDETGMASHDMTSSEINVENEDEETGAQASTVDFDEM